MPTLRIDRRGFLAVGAAAIAAWNTRAAALSPPPTDWAPYVRSIAIDAAGMFGRWPGTPDGMLSDVDVADARESGLTAVVLTLAPNGRFRFGADAFETTVRNIAHWERQIAARPDTFLRIDRADDIARARRENKVGVIYGFQESSPIGEDLDRIDTFHALGLRVLQLTHNRRNLVGDGCMEPGDAGLSAFGRGVIERCNTRRVLVDLAHGGRRTTREAIAASKAPVLIGHTGCAALADLPRNTADAELRALAERGGVVGILFWPFLRVDGQPMANDLLWHLEHAIDVCGEDHVGIGSDNSISPVAMTPEFVKDNTEFMQMLLDDGTLAPGRSTELVTFLPDLNHARRYETIAAMLSSRGHSDARIEKILGGNFARVMGEVWG
ncbi:dipeptidase [Chiayiivirga flava]|uniref:Membrane dipeptidase n=1 Tax=Chiayiivirga flava TaxID=659595 RepID=A0A7W8G0E8_9GAMM|nr:membrane dipeptidase [Chiayiivirga flava]MBB5209106.1 membrane dipeptidase [Chiayiivirga flava]